MVRKQSDDVRTAMTAAAAAAAAAPAAPALEPLAEAAVDAAMVSKVEASATSYLKTVDKSVPESHPVRGSDGSTRWPCPHVGCKKSFTTKGNMKRHFLSSHRRLRPFACDFCSRRFARKDDAFIHRRTHTGLRPHTCSGIGCGARFNRTS